MNPSQSNLSVGGGLTGAASGGFANPSAWANKISLPSSAPPAPNPGASLAGYTAPPKSLMGGSALSLAGLAPSSPAAGGSSLSIGSNGYAYPSYLTDFYNSLAPKPVVKPTAPVSSQTGQPLNYGSGADASTSYTATVPNGDGSSNIVDAHGNNLSGNTFSLGSDNTDTGSTTDTTDLNTGTSSSDVASTLDAHQQYIQQLGQAEGYSPAYKAAYQASQQAQAAATQYQNEPTADPAGLESTTGGATTAYVDAAGGVQEAQANIAAIPADINLQTQALDRQGSIDAASALVSNTGYQSLSPGSSLVSEATGQGIPSSGATSYTDYQAESAYSSLQQEYPDANIPAYDPTQSPQANLQIAQAAAAQAPSFQSKNTIEVALPGGGISLVDKNQIATDPSTGQSVIISPSDATTAAAASSAIQSLTEQQANTSRAISTADANFPLLLQTMKAGGINDFDAPIANQLQQAVNNKLIGSGAMASFNALATSLQTEYSAIVSRGGSVTDTARNEAAAIVNNTISYNAMADLYQTLQADGANVINAYTTTINQYQQQLKGIYANGTPLSGSSASGSGSTGNTTALSW